jgi:hypothetical protein
VIVVHGTNRNSEDYFDRVEEARADVAASRTAVLAPHFGISSDLAGFGLTTGNAIYWDSEWREGSQSVNSGTTYSSFAVMDTLISQMTTVFPSLNMVVVTGHSAGGQFVSRHAAGTQTTAPVRFVPSNPSSWLYLDALRPAPGSTTSFRALTTSEINACSSYNRYKYGLSGGLNPYMTISGAALIRTQFATREVIYLLGDQDTDTNDPDLDTTCEGNWQGPQRYHRGTAYFNYLGVFYGASIYQKHSKVVVPGVGHDSSMMYDSTGGKNALFF